MGEETTFRSYNEEQGKIYAKARYDYHQEVYNVIINHHTSTGGQLDTIMDVGCGPGLVERALSPKFVHGVGLDHSEGMIKVARMLGGSSSASEPILFEVSSAEELGADLSPPIQEGTVDLITAATAAHWFDMDRFWPQAARMLKPGGSVAIWISGDAMVHPSVPNGEAIQAVMMRYREQHLTPFLTRGNAFSQDAYDTMALPWDIAQPVPEFEKSDLFQKRWKHGENFFAIRPEMNMDGLEDIMSTMSPVTRWREAHPDAVGTEKDVIRMLRREVEGLLHEAGVEPGKEKVTVDSAGSLLMLKKKI